MNPNFLRRTSLAALLAASSGMAWQTNTLYHMQTTPLLSEPGSSDTAYYFDTAKTDGAYKRLPVAMREGGWSSLERDTTDPTGHTFWTVNDRGMNVAYELGGRTDKVFAFPGYHHKIARYKVEGDSLRILSLDSLASLEDAAVFTTGLVSTKAATGETALRMRKDSAIVDSSPGNRLAPVVNGYDFETIRRKGNSLFLSDEYGPFVVKADIPTMRIVQEWYPGHGLPAVLAKRRANRGMEGMAVTPSGKVLGILQSPMYNVKGVVGSNGTRDGEMVRVVWLDPATGATREFAYLLDLKGGLRRGRDVKTSEVVALSETRFLVLEQGEENVSKKYHIDVFEIDVSRATDVSAAGADGLLLGGKTLEEIAKVPGALALAGIRPVAKRLLVGDLLANTPWRSTKPEGLTVVDDSTLAISNDNDYGMTDYGADGIPHMLPADQIVVNTMYLRVPSLAGRLADSSLLGGLRLTILHNNDGESQLIDAGNGATDRGGIHRFKALVDTARAQAAAAGRSVVTLTAGDNFLAGKEWQASMSRDSALPVYDGLALDRIGYDALCLGNHDFDFGPDVLARFIASFQASKAPFLSSNLSFADEPRLKALADSGRIKPWTIVERQGQKIGIVGGTTPTISFISSPRRTTIDTNIVARIQQSVDTLVARGVDKIIVISHLQALANDTTMAHALRHVDIMLAGGGDELLAKPGALLQPGDSVPVGTYPLAIRDADGRKVYVVTAPGDYLYLGQLDVDFDTAGEVTNVLYTSGPRRVVGGSYPDAVGEDAWVESNVRAPVAAFVQGLSNQIVGNAKVGLDGTRNSVRSKATNLGALSADAMLWQSRHLAAQGIDSAVFAIQNGGGIRNNGIVPAGDLSMATLFDIHPFGNMFAVFPHLPVKVLKDALENAYRSLPATAGNFGQIAGGTVWIDTTKAPMTIDAFGALATHGSRVRFLVLDGGDTLVRDGAVVDSARTVPFATIDFMARGGDGYPLAGESFQVAPIPQHQFLANFIGQGLGGSIDSAAYPQDFRKRILFLAGGTVGVARHATGYSIRQSRTMLVAKLSLAEAGAARMDLVDVAGRTVASIPERELASGNQELSLPVSGLGRGTFVLRLRAPGISKTQLVQIAR